MSDFDPNAFLAQAKKKGKGEDFDPDQFIAANLSVKPKEVEVTEEPGAKISTTGSALTGASVSGSFGLTRPVLSLAGMISGMKPKEAWKVSGEFIKEAKKQNPTSYGAGYVGGLLAPGGAFKGVSKGVASLAARGARPLLAETAGTTAASALQAGGAAAAEGNEGKAADEIINAMAANIAAMGAGEVVKGAGKLAFKGGKKFIGSLNNVSEESIDTYAKNRKAVLGLIKNKMEDFAPRMADDVAAKVKDVGQQLEMQLDQVVNAHPGVVDVKPIVTEIERQVSKLERLQMTPQKRAAAREISNTWLNFTKKAEETGFTAADVVEMKRDFQAMAESVYEGSSRGPVQDAFAAIADKTAQALKDAVPGTREILAKEQAAIVAKKALGISGVPDAARMKNLLSTMHNPDKVQKGLTKAAKEFDSIYGTNLHESGKLFKAASQLGKEDIISGYGTGRALTLPFMGGLINQAAGLAGMIVQSPALTKPAITGLKQIPKLTELAAGQLPAATRAYQGLRGK